MRKILCFFGFHKFLNCKKLVFGVDGYWDMDWKPICEPWLLYTVIESRYECQDCKRKFWMPSGNFEEIKMGEKISALLTTPKSKEK